MHARSLKFTVTGIGLVLLVSAAGPGSPAEIPAAPAGTDGPTHGQELQELADHLRATNRFRDDGVVRGITWEASRRQITDDDLHPLIEAGVEWISQVPYGFQRDPHAPTFALPGTRRVWWGESDEGLEVTTHLAKRHGLRVMLKPQLWVQGRGTWAGDIAMKSDQDWGSWFRVYTEFIVHYAELAEANGIDMISVGTELAGTIHREAEWREVIAAVREVYSGRLTYSANWNRSYLEVGFWDALDYIGVSAYFPLNLEPRIESDTSATLRESWKQPRDQLAALAHRVGKPLIFTEAGYRSESGSVAEPWEWRNGGAVDLEIQAAGYDALLATFWPEPWFAGVFFWKWGAHRDGGPDDEDYTPRNKPAAAIMARWFQQPAVRPSH